MSTLALWYDGLNLPTPLSTEPAPVTGLWALTPKWLRQRFNPEPVPEPVPAPLRPKAELHFNLWRDLTEGLHFLDVGIRLSDVDDLRAFYLYVPAPLQRDQVQDLGSVLKLGQTLNAVFNSVIKLDEQGDNYFTTTENNKPHLTIHQTREDDIILEPFEALELQSGAQLLFSEELCRRIRNRCASDPARAAYVRIRLQLTGRSHELFTNEIRLGERMVENTLTRQELTEFRFNEKRSYPQSIAELASDRSFVVTAIHYFLIRDFKHQLTNQHEPSRKVRRLERGMWQHYLAAGADPEAVKPALAITERMLIYHWRKMLTKEEIAGGKSIDSFLAFASFRQAVPNLMIYALAVVFLGALGSLLATAAGAVMSSALVSLSVYLYPFATNETPADRAASWAMLVSLLTLGVGMLIAWLYYFRREAKRQKLGKEAGAKRLENKDASNV